MEESTATTAMHITDVRRYTNKQCSGKRKADERALVAAVSRQSIAPSSFVLKDEMTDAKKPNSSAHSKKFTVCPFLRNNNV